MNRGALRGVPLRGLCEFLVLALADYHNCSSQPRTCLSIPRAEFEEAEENELTERAQSSANIKRRKSQGGPSNSFKLSRRPFFTPRDVPKELSDSTRPFAKACLTLLGCNEMHELRPEFALWHKALKEVCPKGTVIRSFDSAENLNNLPQKTLDRLYVATINTESGTVFRAMVLWKAESL